MRPAPTEHSIDNWLYPGQDPLLDTWGLIFQDVTLSSPMLDVEWNIWGNGPATPYSTYQGSSAGGYSIVDTGSAYTLIGTVPEPASGIEAVAVLLAFCLAQGLPVRKLLRRV